MTDPDTRPRGIPDPPGAQDIPDAEERSQRIRDLLGRRPHWLLRWGIVLVAAVMAAAAAAAYALGAWDALRGL